MSSINNIHDVELFLYSPNQIDCATYIDLKQIIYEHIL